MINDLRLIKNHYSKDFLLKDIFVLCFSGLIGFIFSNFLLYIIDNLVVTDIPTFFFFPFLSLHFIFTIVAIIASILTPITLLIFSIQENLIQIKQHNHDGFSYKLDRQIPNFDISQYPSKEEEE